MQTYRSFWTSWLISYTPVERCLLHRAITSSPAMDTLGTALAHQHTHMLSLSCRALTIPEAALLLACCMQSPDSQFLAPLISEPDMAAWPAAAEWTPGVGAGLMHKGPAMLLRSCPREAGLCSNILAENDSPFRH